MNASSEQELADLRKSVRGFLSVRQEGFLDRAKTWDAPLIDLSSWQRMATELDVQGLAIPQQYGGHGYGLPELRIVLEECGRSLAPLPFLSTVIMAATALSASQDDDACTRYLPDIASGRLLATLAAVEKSGRWFPAEWMTKAEERDGQWWITGTKFLVLDGLSSDVYLVLAHTSAGLTLFEVERGAEGLRCEPMPGLDLTRRYARAEFANVPSWIVGSLGAGEAILENVLEYLRIGLAAEAVGAAERCLEMSVDYAKTRYQFGRAIGSFQAVKHLCAEMFAQLEGARASLAEATLSERERPDDLPLLAVVSFVECARMFFFVARENIQVHGGIGFTWEHDAHLYFRRAKATELVLGGPATDYEAVLTKIGV